MAGTIPFVLRMSLLDAADALASRTALMIVRIGVRRQLNGTKYQQEIVRRKTVLRTFRLVCFWKAILFPSAAASFAQAPAYLPL